MFETFPPKLTELVLDDEWNKAKGMHLNSLCAHP